MESEPKLWLERWGGWTCITVLCAIPVLRWVTLAPLNERFMGAYGVFTTLGRLLGIVGFMLFAINLLLSVRRTWLENFFGGLNRVYIAHHLTGGIAFVLILFHPLFLALRYIEIHSLVSIKDAAQFLLPRGIHFNGTFYEVEQAASINNGIIAFLGLTGLMFVTFFTKLPYRLWLLTHKFLGLAFLFTGLHVLFVTSDITGDMFLKVYFTLWTIIGLTAYVYRTLLGNIFVRRAPYKVEAVQILPRDVVAVALRPVERPIDFKPGQFVFIRFLWAKDSGINKETHPFSIASAPGEDNLRLYMKSLGDYTKSLTRLQPGMVAEVEGAFGRFLPGRFKFSEQIWIAGGIGVTPFLSLARSYASDNPKVTLIHSVVKREELVDQKALAEFLPAHYPNFHYEPFVTDEKGAYLTAGAVQSIVGDLKEKEIFLCGPPPMMHALTAQLISNGVSKKHIHSEEFSMS